nr:PREDICTED: leukotriene C4 synthase-like [Struthio camelus australis]
MRNQIDLLAAVTVLGVLEQAYFALQVIYARRKYKISPPETRGHPEFERIFRAQVNCSEYFPIFISLLWVAGIFFHQGKAEGKKQKSKTPKPLTNQETQI